MTKRQLNTAGDDVGIDFDIENATSEQILVRWRRSFVHLKDDTGREYRQSYEDDSGYNALLQFEVPPRSTGTIRAAMSPWVYANSYSDFWGPFDPGVKYLIFKVDLIAGLSDLNWRFDLR